MLAGSRHFFVHVILFGFDVHRVEVLTLRALECLGVVAGIVPLDSDKPGLRPAPGAQKAIGRFACHGGSAAAGALQSLSHQRQTMRMMPLCGASATRTPAKLPSQAARTAFANVVWVIDTLVPLAPANVATLASSCCANALMMPVPSPDFP
jgi:hypothetical protein